MKQKKNDNSKVKINYGKKREKPTIKGFFRFLRKTLIIALFVIYLVVGVLGTSLWGKTVAHRSLDMDNIQDRVTNYRQSGKFPSALFTVHVQKLSRSEEVLEQMLPLIPELEAPFFFELSRRYVYLGDMDEAAFWHMLGAYHMRYDYMRCEDLYDTEFLEFFIQRETEPLLLAYLRDNEELINKIIPRVASWDKANPIQNRPEYFCGLAKIYYTLQSKEISGKALPESTWPPILAMLRKEINAPLATIKKQEEQK